jgi:cysteine desulfurase
MYGPKGQGALYVRRRNPHVRLEPILDGGGHERGMRSGTLAVQNIVGLGVACELCRKELEEESQRLTQLRESLRHGLQSQLEEVTLNGHPTDRLPSNLNLSFAWVESEGLMMATMKDVAVSSGSACTSVSREPSYVLKAMGVSDDLAHASIRFGLGRFNTQEEVDYVITQIVAAVKRLREMSPEYEMHRNEIAVKVQA